MCIGLTSIVTLLFVYNHNCIDDLSRTLPQQKVKIEYMYDET